VHKILRKLLDRSVATTTQAGLCCSCNPPLRGLLLPSGTPTSVEMLLDPICQYVILTSTTRTTLKEKDV